MYKNIDHSKLLLKGYFIIDALLRKNKNEKHGLQTHRTQAHERERYANQLMTSFVGYRDEYDKVPLLEELPDYKPAILI